jgi:hypothetical protein
MVELWRWVMMVTSKRKDATAADHTGSSRRTAGQSRLAQRGCR